MSNDRKRNLDILSAFCVLIGVLFMMASSAFAAKKPQDISMILKQSNPAERMDQLQVNPKSKYRALRELAFDQKAELRLRWKALMSLALIGREESLPELELAASSPDWFMRDAALKAMVRVSPDAARTWARRFLSDPALVVRTTAVLSIRELADKKSLDILWEKLYAPENFRGAQSLWIRRHIVQTIAAFRPKDSYGKFIKLMDDSDKTVSLAAVTALETTTGMKLGRPQDPLSVKTAYWRRWSDSRKPAQQ
jgi:HEAT repeat protein